MQNKKRSRVSLSYKTLPATMLVAFIGWAIPLVMRFWQTSMCVGLVMLWLRRKRATPWR